jgi:hypothetical protein
MPLIQTQSAKTAAGEVAEIYRQMQQAWGNVPNGFALFSASPLWLKQQWEYVGYYMQASHAVESRRTGVNAFDPVHRMSEAV